MWRETFLIHVISPNTATTEKIHHHVNKNPGRCEYYFVKQKGNSILYPVSPA